MKLIDVQVMKVGGAWGRQHGYTYDLVDVHSRSGFYKPRGLPRKSGNFGQNPALERSERAVCPLGGGWAKMRIFSKCDLMR
jgi:hypothetical protein